MLVQRGINPLLVLRIAVLAFTLFVAVAGLLAALWVLSVLLTRRNARRMGTSVMPIAVRLVPHSGPVSPEIEARAARLKEAGYREVGRFATDRPPRATIIGFVAPDGSHGAVAVEHAAHGTFIELSRRDAEGGTASVVDIRLPRAKRAPWMRVISKPGASVAAMRTALEAHSPTGTPVVHDAASFVTRFETTYRRAMDWAYTEGPLRSVDPEAMSRTTGVQADADTVYFLKMRREAAGTEPNR